MAFVHYEIKLYLLLLFLFLSEQNNLNRITDYKIVYPIILDTINKTYNIITSGVVHLINKETNEEKIL